jgi:hypothetical protein
MNVFNVSEELEYNRKDFRLYSDKSSTIYNLSSRLKDKVDETGFLELDKSYCNLVLLGNWSPYNSSLPLHNDAHPNDKFTKYIIFSFDGKNRDSKTFITPKKSAYDFLPDAMKFAKDTEFRRSQNLDQRINDLLEYPCDLSNLNYFLNNLENFKITTELDLFNFYSNLITCLDDYSRNELTEIFLNWDQMMRRTDSNYSSVKFLEWENSGVIIIINDAFYHGRLGPNSDKIKRSFGF